MARISPCSLAKRYAEISTSSSDDSSFIENAWHEQEFSSNAKTASRGWARKRRSKRKKRSFLISKVNNEVFILKRKKKGYLTRLPVTKLL